MSWYIFQNIFLIKKGLPPSLPANPQRKFLPRMGIKDESSSQHHGEKEWLEDVYLVAGAGYDGLVTVVGLDKDVEEALAKEPTGEWI